MLPMNNHRCLSTLLRLILASFSSRAQQPQSLPAQGQNPQRPQDQNQQPSALPRELPQDSIRPNYVLGPNDQVLIRAPEVEEINEKPFRIDAEGNMNLPLLGRVRAGGMSVQEMEADQVRRFREYVREPHVITTLAQFRIEP